MIDWYAVLLAHLDSRPELSFEEELVEAMSHAISGETAYEELERRYPNWRDLI